MSKGLIVGGFLAALALVGLGVALGNHLGQQNAVVAQANAEGPLTPQDQVLMGSFTEISGTFDELLAQAANGKPVGEKMTRIGVAALNVERLAAHETFQEAAGVTADAMLLIAAGITANDNETVNEGAAAYRESQQAIVELARELDPDADIPDIPPLGEDTGSSEPNGSVEPEPSGDTAGPAGNDADSNPSTPAE